MAFLDLKISFLLIFSLLVFSSTQFIDTGKLRQNKDDKYTFLVNFVNETISKDLTFKHHSWDTAAYITDTFGTRLLGSQGLQKAIDYIKSLLTSEGFENVKMENVELKQRWVRGKEHLMMLSPRPFPSKINMVGLGKTIGGNVTAEVIMINDFDELEEKGENGEIKGKIVFFNAKWVSYGKTVAYRSRGPSLAAKHGAIGVVIRSVSSKSMENPHTGMTAYDEKYPKIPACAVSIESADMFERMINRGQVIKLNLYMEAKYIVEDFTTYNVVGDITGSKYPDEIILMGGHIDSWDVGPQTGANDDLGGVMVCYEALRFLIKSGLRPLRTLRFIAWVGEEQGDPVRGATAYLKTHEKEMDNHILAFESDGGTTDIYGFGYSGGAKGYNLINFVSQLFLKQIGMQQLNRDDGGNADTAPLFETYKIPTMRNLVRDTPDEEYYFTYHHSSADSMNIINPDEMDRNVIGIASMFYILADVPWRVPRD